MPPSPRLSARMTMVRYLKVTTKFSDQKMSDRMPSTLLRGYRDAVRTDEALLEGVERAGADVAIHHAEGPERQEGELLAG